MKNQFTIPRGCFTKQEATRVFQSKGISGIIDIGLVSKDEEYLIVWRCKSTEQEFLLPVLKRLLNTSLPSPESFEPIESGQEYYFSIGDEYYIIDKTGDLHQIEILFNESVAKEVISLFIEYKPCAMQLYVVAPKASKHTQHYICWGWIGEDNIPIFHPVFSDDHLLFRHLYSKNPNVGYTPLAIGGVFDHNKAFWQVAVGENGVTIYPLNFARTDIS